MTEKEFNEIQYSKSMHRISTQVKELDLATLKRRTQDAKEYLEFLELALRLETLKEQERLGITEIDDEGRRMLREDYGELGQCDSYMELVEPAAYCCPGSVF